MCSVEPMSKPVQVITPPPVRSRCARSDSVVGTADRAEFSVHLGGRVLMGLCLFLLGVGPR
jgi:hypothetical protein